MNNKRIYYSCCTWLCYEIGQRFYGERHYVWCTPYFDPPSRMNKPNSVPPTSNPRDIYWALKKEIDAGDLHSTKIAQNRSGILNGARAQLTAGVIGMAEYKEIDALATMAHLHEFRPLMLVIPGTAVTGLLRKVDITKRASLMSEEYIIERLPRRLFDAIEL
jgi:hypothetical protein